MDELDFYDPEDLELVEFEAPKRKRRKRKNPEPAIAVATPVLLLGLGYVAWCWYNQTRFKVWNWQPWKLAGLTKPRLQLRRANTNNAQAEEERRRAAFHRAVDESMKSSLVTIDTEVPWRPVFADTEKEKISFIYP